MRALELPARLLSDAVWRRILECSSHLLYTQREEFCKLMASLESLRERADYDTGSISMGSAWALFSASSHFGPKHLLEIGTFIGRSTLALALGADAARSGVALHTCDLSNALELPAVTRCTIRQYPRTSSTAMLAQLVAAHHADRAIDFMHFDGRLQPDDIPLLRTICSPDCIVALDDFEGVEKGVANLANMRTVGFLTSHLLIHPCRQELLREFGFPDHSSTALLLPANNLRMTPQ